MYRIRVAAVVALLATFGIAPAAVASESNPVGLGGTPVEGSTSASDPTELTAGVSSDTLAAGETTHHYSYRRTTDFSAVHVGVVSTTDQDTDTVTVTGTVGEDVTCGTDYESSPSFTNTAFGARMSFLGAGPEDRNDECLTSDVVHFTVDHTGPDAELPVAVTVVEERPTELRSTIDLPAVPDTEPAFEAPSGGGGEEEVSGGTSFDDAPEIEGGTWTGTIESGDELLYAVDDVDWGQTLSVRATSPELTKDQVAKIGISSPSLALEVMDPLRNPLDVDPEGATSEATMSEEEEAVATTASGPVRYLDRFESSPSYLPGRHWISVRMTGPGDEQPIEVPIKLEVEVQGEQSGVPTYDGDEEPFLVAEDTWSSTVSVGDDGLSILRVVLAGALGLVGAVCIGAGALRLRRRGSVGPA